jgi:uncharacterized SAM-binding protein YcdF (DUF218 family)
MYILKAIIGFSVSPMGMISIFFLVGFIVTILKHRSRWAHGFMMAGAFLFLVFTFTPVADILIRQLEVQYPPLTNLPETAPFTYIAVLSHYTVDDQDFPITSNVSQETLCRVAEAIRLYRMLPESRIIVSGGFFYGARHSQASLMSDCLQTLGVPESSIITEEHSRDTFENLMGIHKIVGVQPFLLVTSAHHMPRAMAAARRLGMNATPAPACISILYYYPPGMSFNEWIKAIYKNFLYPSALRWQHLEWAHHEYLGYLWYMLTGRA